MKGKYLQKKRNVTDKEFDPEEKDKSGGRHFLPAIWSNFGNLSIIVHKEKLIIWSENREKNKEKLWADINNVWLQMYVHHTKPHTARVST